MFKYFLLFSILCTQATLGLGFTFEDYTVGPGAVSGKTSAPSRVHELLGEINDSNCIQVHCQILTNYAGKCTDGDRAMKHVKKLAKCYNFHLSAMETTCDILVSKEECEALTKSLARCTGGNTWTWKFKSMCLGVVKYLSKPPN